MTFVSPLILSLCVLSIYATPRIHLNLRSAASVFFSYAFFAAHVSAPYIIAGLTTVSYVLPLTPKSIVRSHRTPDTLFQRLHPSIISYCIHGILEMHISCVTFLIPKSSFGIHKVFSCICAFKIIHLLFIVLIVVHSGWLLARIWRKSYKWTKN